jgi:hypothetical protein
MTTAPTAPATAGGPPAHVAASGGTPPGAGGPPNVAAIADRYLKVADFPNKLFELLDGREKDLAEGLIMVLRTIADNVPYIHEHNDALIKLHLQSVQFAKDRGLMDEFVEHDVKTMAPVNARMGKMIEATGEKEIAVIAVAEFSGCHFQMITERPRRSHDGLRRTWTSPFKTALDAGTGIGQFDTTEEWLHYNYTIPRFQGYAKTMGVEFEFNEWDESTREVWVQVK